MSSNFSAGARQCSIVTISTTNFEVFIVAGVSDISSLAVLSHSRRTKPNKRRYVYNDQGTCLFFLMHVECWRALAYAGEKFFLFESISSYQAKQEEICLQ